MKLMDFLVAGAIEPEMKSVSKADAIRELVSLLKKTGTIDDEASVSEVVLEREELGSTGIGEGLAVPHGKSNSVGKLVAAFGRSEKGIEFDSIDKQPVHLVFLLVAPEDSAGPHLMALARISRLLKNREFRDGLMNAKDKMDILKLCESEA